MPRRAGALLLGCVAVAVAAVGYRSGAGDTTGALTALIAGAPGALLLAVALAQRPVPLLDPAVRGVHPLPGTDPADLLRTAAALLCAAADDPTTRAVRACAAEPLPGVSDLDGTPASGLRGVVSELQDRDDGPVVIAHAALVGPPAWLSAHGVAPPDPLDADTLAVAWDGIARGALVIGRDAGPAPWPVRAALVVGGASTAAGAVLADLLTPVSAGAVPVGATLLVALLGCLPQHHPIGATS